jgi:hypothetical protein
LQIPLDNLLKGWAEKQKKNVLMLNYFQNQIEFLSNICLGRYEDAANVLTKKYNLKLLVYLIFHDTLPDELRASFCKLFVNLYVERESFESSSILNQSSWSNSITEVAAESMSDEHDKIIAFIKSYLSRLVKDNAMAREIHFFV